MMDPGTPHSERMMQMDSTIQSLLSKYHGLEGNIATLQVSLGCEANQGSQR